MSFPSSPTNGQTAVLNGVVYSYSSTSNSWTKVSSSVTATNTLAVVSTQSSTSTATGALTVSGGVGIGGNLYVGGTSYIAGAQILTTATVNSFVTAGVSSVSAGTGTIVNTATGAVTISINTATLMANAVSASTASWATTASNLASPYVSGITVGTDTAISTSTGAVPVSYTHLTLPTIYSV